MSRVLHQQDSWCRKSCSAGQLVATLECATTRVPVHTQPLAQRQEQSLGKRESALACSLNVRLNGCAADSCVCSVSRQLRNKLLVARRLALPHELSRLLHVHATVLMLKAHCFTGAVWDGNACDGRCALRQAAVAAAGSSVLGRAWLEVGP